MFRIVIVILLLLVASLAAEPLMTLEDAITLGLKNNYDIRIARNQTKISTNSKGMGLAGFLPTLNASGGYSLTDSDQDVDLPLSTAQTDIENLNAELTLNWTLFDGFRMFVDRKRFNELALLGELQARNRIESSVVAISKSYFSLVLQELLLEVARDTRDVSETRLEREQVRNQLGGASTTDFFNAQVAFNSDQSTLLNQELQVTIARQYLNILLGQDPGTELSVSTEIPIPELTLSYSQLLKLAMEQNSVLKTAELGEKIAHRNVQNARSPFLPHLSAFASHGYLDNTLNSSAGQYPGFDIGTQTTSTTVGLSLSLNLFNGRRDRINLQNAKIEAFNQALALRDTRNRVNGLVRETLDTYRQRSEVVILEEQNIEAARQNLDLQRERNNLGIANSLEFRDAQVSHARARTSLITARYQARISRLEVDQLTGVLRIE